MSGIPFHPLADLFPFIEGPEFDELAYSIMQHGLRDPITLLDGMILDGRNRYRACDVAGVKPRFENFTGDDPHAFVADKNIHRRHLSPPQLAMVAARMANVHLGDNQHKREGVGIPTPSISLARAAEIMNVSRDTVSNAKRVLEEGTPEEIAAADRGEIGVGPLADRIRARSPRDRRADRGGQSQPRTSGLLEKQNKAKLRAQTWGDLKVALTGFTNLPRAADVVPIARSHDRTGLIDKHLFSTLQWLKDFAHEWSNRSETSGEAEQSANDHADTGTGE